MPSPSLKWSPLSKRIYVCDPSGRRRDVTNQFMSILLARFRAGYSYSIKDQRTGKQYEISVLEIQ